jgi:cytochrome c551/c552
MKIRKGTAGAALAMTAAAVVLAGCSSAASHVRDTNTASPAVGSQAAKPAGNGLSAAQITDRLKRSGLPVSGVIVYTPVTDPNHMMGRQNGYTSKTAWADPTIAKQDAGDEKGSIGLGGGIEVSLMRRAHRRATNT